MRNKLLIIIVLLLPVISFGQELNRVIIDSTLQKEVLIGYCDRSGLLIGEFKDHYLKEYAAYKPDKKQIKKLKKTINDFSITIVMASWCSDSKEQVPRFYKIIDKAKFDYNKLTLIAVDRTKLSDDVDIEEFDIVYVPTFIVFEDGNEIGRIIETPDISLEQDLLNILLK